MVVPPAEQKGYGIVWYNCRGFGVFDILVSATNGAGCHAVSLVLLCIASCPAVLRRRTVDLHLAVADHLLDLALLLEILQALPCQGTVDLESVDEGSNGDEAVGLHILVQLLGRGLVEDDGVLGLVLDCEEKEENTSASHSSVSSKCKGARFASPGCGVAEQERLWPFATIATSSHCADNSRRHESCKKSLAISHPAGSVLDSGSFHLPLPFDHFFFCFFAPVFAGAMFAVDRDGSVELEGTHKRRKRRERRFGL